MARGGQLQYTELWCCVKEVAMYGNMHDVARTAAVLALMAAIVPWFLFLGTATAATVATVAHPRRR